MFRLLGAIVAGLLAALVVVFLTDTLAHTVVMKGAPMPQPSDEAAMLAYIASLPVLGLLAIAVGWGLAALLGAFVAARWTWRGRWTGWLVAGFLGLATVANFVMFPHPAWFMAASLLLIAGAGWLGAWWGAQVWARAGARRVTAR